MPKKFTKTVLKSIKTYKLNNNILTSENSTPELKKEIKRVFQAANRRIQNIENAGLYSPALKALNFQTDNFSKFNLSGKSWNDIKIAYSQAVSFLRQPTSTASGTKTFLQNTAEIENFGYKDLRDLSLQLENLEKAKQHSLTIYAQTLDVGDSPQKLMRMANTLYKEYKDISEQLETASEKLENIKYLKEPLLTDLKRGYMDLPAADVNTILDALNDLE